MRRTTWLAARGFAATPSPPGYEAWSFAVACAAHGGRIARVAGAIHLPGAPGDDPEVRRRVLELHPALLTRLARDADRRAADAAGRAVAAEARAAAAAQEVAALRDDARVAARHPLVARPGAAAPATAAAICSVSPARRPTRGA